jgi:hypothetical protein
MTQQQGIMKGDAQQRLGSAGFIIGPILMMIGSLLLPPSLGVSNWQEMISDVGEQAVRLQACALLITFGYWAVMIGTVGVYRSITAGGAAWARLGFYFYLIGTAMWTVGMSVGDVGYPAAAANWLAAPDAGKEAAYIALAAIPGFTRGLFPMEVIVIWLAFAFLGIGMVHSDVYPRWLGWVGLILGIAGMTLGIFQTFTGRETTLNLFMVLNISTMLWSLVVGIWVARRAW